MADVAPPRIVIFVSSPSDVMVERERAARVIDIHVGWQTLSRGRCLRTDTSA